MSARRLPVYLLLDTSGSMRGEPIESVNIGLRAMLASLRQHPHAPETVHLSIVTFDSTIQDVLPLTRLDAVVLPEIRCPESGATLLGEGLERICAKVAAERIGPQGEQPGDWLPLLFIMTDGKPSDTLAYSEVIPRVQSLGFGAIIACAAGPKADPKALQRLTPKVVSLDTMDSATFAGFFQWVSSTVSAAQPQSGESSPDTLPPPPPVVQIFL